MATRQTVKDRKSAGHYQQWRLQTGTALGETDDSWVFCLAVNKDLFAIKKSNTETHSTEVHIFTRASNYQRFSPFISTALGETDDSWVFCLAANRDLFAIKKSNTDTHTTEVHILTAASNYQQFKVRIGTALGETDASWVFCLGGIGMRDLFAIHKSGTETHTTEVHVLSAASNYQEFSLHTGTALGETDAIFDFCLSQNGDLFAIQKSGTDTHSTELHIMAGDTQYQQWRLQTGTALGETDAIFVFCLASYSGSATYGDLFAIQKSGTDTRSTELHILAAEV
ncbi:MAG: VCBS repeat-containing protein [Bacteroidota bacterium]|jgi:hypothetical protein